MEAPVRKLREKFIAENRITELYKREVSTEDVICIYIGNLKISN